ncbi:hypothetical protein Lal_00000876 [Lupinus albus]|nr:hypothetical protein Lal_00000876 [Lupinus albus]
MVDNYFNDSHGQGLMFDANVPPKETVTQDQAPLQKSFAQVLNNNVELNTSQLPQLCLKGDAIAIKIPEEDYQAVLQKCKTNLHGRLILSEGDTPIKFTYMRAKLPSL